MGCGGNPKEKLEYEIMVLKVNKIDIIQERIDKLKELEKITGKPVYRRPVPDYLIREEEKKESEETQNPTTDARSRKSSKADKFEKASSKSKKKKKKNDDSEDEDE